VVNIEDFIEIAPSDPEVMNTEIIKTIDNLQNPIYIEIMRLIFKQFGEDFKV
jgi:hypothetical protein